MLDDDKIFSDPIKFSMTGFEHKTPQKSFIVNYSRSLGFRTPCEIVGSSGLVRAFAEIDLLQIQEISDKIKEKKDEVITKNDFKDIELKCTTCEYNGETFFSLFEE